MHKWLFELIDTWWDVNQIVVQIRSKELWELIDTWWDVNKITTIMNVEFQGINRYMVGCKFLILTIGQLALKRINRYMVGCKCLIE